MVILFKIFFKSTDLIDIDFEFKQTNLTKTEKTKLQKMFFKTTVNV